MTGLVIVLVVIAAFLAGVAVGMASSKLLAATVREQIAMKQTEHGRLIHKADHRCNPPDSIWTPRGDCLVGYGGKVAPGDQWVCGCTKVWESREGHWNEVES